MATDVIYKVLDVAGLAATKTIEATQKPLGFKTDIYFPVHNPSAYGNYDNVFMYLDEPDIEKKNLLFSGIVVKRRRGDTTWEPYVGEEVRLFATNQEAYPNDSKVVIFFYDSNDPQRDPTKLVLRIDFLESFHSHSFLYHEYVLVPMEGC